MTVGVLAPPAPPWALTGGEKRHAPTPRRRLRAQEQGRGWRSPDFQGATALAVALLLMSWYLPWAGHWAIHWEQWGLGQPVGTDFASSVDGLWRTAIEAVAVTAGPAILVLFAVGTGLGLWQSGLRLNFSRVAPDFARLNPIAGLERMFSRQGLWLLVQGLMKLAVLAVLVGFYLWGQLKTLATLSGMPLGEALSRGEGVILGAVVRAAVAYWAISALDVVYQIRRFEASLRMSTQELRDEFKETEGDPKIRGRRREMMRRLARSGLSAVRGATVVVTNPQHYAVALLWEEAQMAAPLVVAKGEDETALRIREVAQEHGVPVVENPPLARSLYTVPVGEPIREEHYQIVAEIIAFLWRQGRRAGRE